jgi:hypothetical protein
VPVKCLETLWRDYNHWRLLITIRDTIHDTPVACEFHRDSQLGVGWVIFKIEVTIPDLGVFEFVSNDRVPFIRKILEPRIIPGLGNALEHIQEMRSIQIILVHSRHSDFLGPVNAKRVCLTNDFQGVNSWAYYRLDRFWIFFLEIFALLVL